MWRSSVAAWGSRDVSEVSHLFISTPALSNNHHLSLQVIVSGNSPLTVQLLLNHENEWQSVINRRKKKCLQLLHQCSTYRAPRHSSVPCCDITWNFNIKSEFTYNYRLHIQIWLRSIKSYLWDWKWCDLENRRVTNSCGFSSLLIP